MTIREQIARFDELIDYISTELPKQAERVAANDLAALITNRVVQRGENAEGARFSPYSRVGVSAKRFKGKSRNQGAEARVSSEKGRISYAEFRRLNNLKDDKKNFEFTGEMWSRFGVKRSSQTLFGFEVILGGRTAAAQEKIDGNSDREGISIIENNAAEATIVQQAVQDWLDDSATRILNAE